MANIGYSQLNTGLTAAGTTQSDAYLLIGDSNFFTTVASGAGAILNSTWSQGSSQTVYNGGANPLTVYPPTSSQLNNLPTNQGMLLPIRTTVTFTKGAYNDTTGVTKWTGVLSR